MKTCDGEVGTRSSLMRLCLLFAVIVGSAVPCFAQESRIFADDGSDWTASILLITGIILFLLELKVVSQGILGFIATVCLTASAVMIWRDGTPFWGIPIGWIIPVIVVAIVLLGFLTWLGIKAQKEKQASGYDAFIGEVAEARESIDPEGRVFFNGSYWDAVSKEVIAPGQKVRIVAADRLKLIVEPITFPDTAAGDANRPTVV